MSRLSVSWGLAFLLGTVPAVWAAKPGDDEIPEAYYGKGGVPVRIRMSTEKIGVRFKKNVAKSNLYGIIKRQAEAEEMDSAQLEAVDRHRNRAAVIRVKPGKAKHEVRKMLRRLREMAEVEDARPVYEVAPDAEELETEYLYASFPVATSESEVQALAAEYDIEILEKIDYSAIGKTGYRFRVPSRNGASTVAIANRLRESGKPIEAAPSFSHLYETWASVEDDGHPNDPLYGSMPYNLSPHRQYTLYNNGYSVACGEGEGEGEEQCEYDCIQNGDYCECEPGTPGYCSTFDKGHINAPGAWKILYQSDEENGFKLKAPFDTHPDVVIAGIDNGVMLDFIKSPKTGIPDSDCPNCTTTDKDEVEYRGHPDFYASDIIGEGEDEGESVHGIRPDDYAKSNQWINWQEVNNVIAHGEGEGEGEFDGDGNGKPRDYFGWDFAGSVDTGEGESEGEDPWPYPVDDPNLWGIAHGNEGISLAAARGNNSRGIAGVCWHAKVMPIRFTSFYMSVGLGGDTLYDKHMADAVRYAADSGAHVVALLALTRSYYPDCYDAIRYARKMGCVVVVPASNLNQDISDPANPNVVYPAALPEVITVGAVNYAGQRCNNVDFGGVRGSNYGWMLDVMAPSGSKKIPGHACCMKNDYVTPNQGNLCPKMSTGPWALFFPNAGANETGAPEMYFTYQGTSAAYPHAAGLAALLLTVNINLSHSEVQAIMQWTAKDLCYEDDYGYKPPCQGGEYSLLHPATGCVVYGKRDKQTGWGVIDCEAAVRKAMKTRFAVTAPPFDRHNHATDATENISFYKNAFSIDEDGDFAIEGLVTPSASEGQLTVAEGRPQFVLRNAEDEVVVRFDPEWTWSSSRTEDVWPTLYLAGDFIHKDFAGTMPVPPAGSLIVKDHEENVVGYFSTVDDTSVTPTIPAGSLVVKGRAFQGGDPDPQMFKTELLIWDNFEDEEVPTPTVYSEKYYATAPAWDPVSGANDWIITDDSPNPQHYVLKSAGSYVQSTHTSDRIRIAQEQEDLDVSFSFKFDDFSGELPDPPVFGRCQTLFRKSANDSVYIRLYRDNNAEDSRKFTRLDLRRYCAACQEQDVSLLDPQIYPNGIRLNQINYKLPSGGNSGQVVGPLVAGTWYEMHIQAQGTVVHVFMRERDTQDKAKRAWATVIPDPDNEWKPGADFERSVISDPLTHFVLWVGHEEEDGREWSFDDISLVKSTLSDTPCE